MCLIFIPILLPFSLIFTSLVIRKRIGVLDKIEWKAKNQEPKAKARESVGEQTNNNKNNNYFVAFWTKRKSLFAFGRMIWWKKTMRHLIDILSSNSMESTHQIWANKRRKAFSSGYFSKTTCSPQKYSANVFWLLVFSFSSSFLYAFSALFCVYCFIMREVHCVATVRCTH